MEPLKENLDAIVMEFKVQNTSKEKSLEETVEHALRQIQENSMTQNCLPEESQRSGSGIMDLRFGGRKC